jgi:hypothetical protein
MLLGFEAEYYFETCFLLASISRIFRVLDFSVGALLNLEQRALAPGSSFGQAGSKSQLGTNTKAESALLPA